jgi:exodeoxyribonuclease VII large subunit
MVREHRFFKYPEEIAGLRADMVDELAGRLGEALTESLASGRLRLHGLERRLIQQRPAARLAAQRGRLAVMIARHQAAARRTMERAAARADQLSRRLEALGPLAVLQRGYSITLNAKTGRTVRSAAMVAEGDRLETILSSRERVRSTVEKR